MKNNIFNLTTRQLKEIAKSLHDKVETGLKEDDTEIKCIPTYVSPDPDKVKGRALVLDLGGTNYRVATIDFSGEQPVIHPENGWKRDLSEMKKQGFTEQDLFKAMTDPIASLKIEGEMPVGYCFSYPAESLPGGDAKLLHWTKGVNIEEMIGKQIGQPLIDYMNRTIGTKFTGIKVINDTVASLFAGLTQKYDAYIGLIVGTGTNMATFIQSDKIKKLSPGLNTGGLIPINLESGNFYPPHLTAVDDIVDACSDNKGRQRFEKAVSGMYLGEILKYVYPYDELEEKFDAQKLTNIMNYPDIHKDRYVRVARWIYERSARLVAASLAGLVLVMVNHDPSIKNIRLIAEGSLFWSTDRKGTNYKDIVMEELENLLDELGYNSVKVHIDQMDNANLIGSAIAALS